MGRWFDNNMSAVREYPFDFQRYIEERLREIDRLDERRFAKELLLDGLGRVIQCMEQKYKKLEQRIFEEVEIGANQYETVMTIVRREHYDPANKTLYPVDTADLDLKKLGVALSDGQRIFLGTVFLEADDGKQREFEAAGRFPGTLDGQSRSFIAVPAVRYRNAVERLYRMFQDNHVPWQTINTGYLDKFYDIYVDAEDTGGKGGVLSLRDAAVRFGEFQESIRTDRIPLWNMEEVFFGSTDFMAQCTDGIYYEHEFSLEDKEEGDGYLVQANEDILEIRHEKGEIVIKSQQETFENWKVLHIIQKTPARSLDYDAPLLTNHRRDSFIRRYAAGNAMQLMTKTDLFRRIMEMDIRDFIEVSGYEICSHTEEYPAVPGMNWFVQDELFPMESRKVLLLKFEVKQPGHYLNGSMVRFVISQLQQEISEYRCVGVTV